MLLSCYYLLTTMLPILLCCSISLFYSFPYFKICFSLFHIFFTIYGSPSLALVFFLLTLVSVLPFFPLSFIFSISPYLLALFFFHLYFIFILVVSYFSICFPSLLSFSAFVLLTLDTPLYSSSSSFCFILTLFLSPSFPTSRYAFLLFFPSQRSSFSHSTRPYILPPLFPSLHFLSRVISTFFFLCFRSFFLFPSCNPQLPSFILLSPFLLPPLFSRLPITLFSFAVSGLPSQIHILSPFLVSLFLTLCFFLTSF